MELYQKFFGNKLDNAIEAAKSSAEELAGALGVNPGSVRKWINGKNFPEDYRLKQICEALNVQESYFLPDLEIKARNDLIFGIISSLDSLNQDELRAIAAVVASSKRTSARLVGR